MQSYRWKFPLIAVMTAIFITFYVTFGITLGLDLKGGTVLFYDVVGKIGTETVNDVIQILHKRLDTLGTKEMTLRKAGDASIMVQLPGFGEQSKEKVKDLISRSGNLSFKIVVPRGDERYSEQTIRDIEERKASGTYEAENDDFDTARLAKSEGGEMLLVQNESAVPGDLLDGANFTHDNWGKPAVSFHMKRSGTARLANTTEKYKGRQMAIILDGVAVSAPRINEPITGGDGIITGTFTQQEVDNLVTVLRSGALPAKPVLASENSVEPTLGQASIKRGMYAMLASVAVVVLFMFIYYRSSGLIANIALVLNVIFLLGVMSLFDFTLTLPGIAGVVLTIGMAVDANILIYERMREEKRRNVPLEEVINAGYAHAFWAIFDSHVTTVCTAIILYYVGTGPIKGFAVTLAIGIAISLFTSLVVTRAIYDFAVTKGILKELRMIEVRNRFGYIPFIKKRMPFVIASIVLFNLGYLSFVVRGDQKYGIDFNGGSVVQMQLVKTLTKADIEKRLEEVTHQTVEGETYHPYADAEVTRLGAAEDPATGAGRRFEVLVSAAAGKNKLKGTGKTSQAPAGASVAYAEEKPAAAGASSSSASAAAPAAEGAVRTQTEQDVFVHDLEKVFETELAPHAFSARTVETDAANAGMARVVLTAYVAQEKAIDPEDAKKKLAAEGLADVEVTAAGPNQLKVRSGLVANGPATLDAAEQQIKRVFERDFQGSLSNPFPLKTSIGASVATSLKYRAVLAIILSLLMIVAYLAFRFEVKMGVAAALCLFHDVLVALGFMMVLDVTSKWTGIDAKQNLQTIAAYLTIVGYSINDTIITFDRMRENLAKWDPKVPREGKLETYEDVLERSINETFGRTILTSLTVVLVLVVLAFAGVKSLEGFTLALLAGVIFGTYSSIVIATPILLVKPRKLLMICAAELAFFIVAAVIGGYLKL